MSSNQIHQGLFLFFFTVLQYLPPITATNSLLPLSWWRKTKAVFFNRLTPRALPRDWLKAISVFVSYSQELPSQTLHLRRCNLDRTFISSRWKTKCVAFAFGVGNDERLFVRNLTVSTRISLETRAADYGENR